MITEEQLLYALKTVRLWIQPEGNLGVAYRGHILHPEDAARDIAIAIAHMGEPERTP
jgi:hypothetical protein